jgi:hypothetical protein
MQLAVDILMVVTITILLIVGLNALEESFWRGGRK